MKTVVITDGKYRSAISAARMFYECGYSVIVTQTEKDTACTPAVFFSKYVSKAHSFPVSTKDEEYKKLLYSFLKTLMDPILFCVGADTLYMVSANKDRFCKVCSFTIAEPSVLDALNDKLAVNKAAGELGIPVPKIYEGVPEHFPVVVKPICGEKAGLSAAQRYRFANNSEEYKTAYEHFSSYGMPVIVQEKVQGDAVGVSILIGNDKKLLCALCHKRIREYPIFGGPSCCCESFYDEEKVKIAYELLSSFGFCGLAMVEFKGKHILEVNPRVWGSFPLALVCGSSFAKNYADSSMRKSIKYIPQNYEIKRMRFFLNDTLCILSLLFHGRIRDALRGVADMFRTKEAIFDKNDKRVFFKYLKNSILGR